MYHVCVCVFVDVCVQFIYLSSMDTHTHPMEKKSIKKSVTSTQTAYWIKCGTNSNDLRFFVSILCFGSPVQFIHVIDKNGWLFFRCCCCYWRLLLKPTMKKKRNKIYNMIWYVGVLNLPEQHFTEVHFPFWQKPNV